MRPKELSVRAARRRMGWMGLVLATFGAWQYRHRFHSRVAIVLALLVAPASGWGAATEVPGEFSATNAALAAVFVREFRFTGNTVFSSAQLARVTAGWTQRALTSGDLEEARRVVTLYYVNQGYVNSGAIYEDQDLADGVALLKVIEGRVTEVRVTPESNWLRERYVRSRLLLAAGPPLNLPRVEDRLVLLRDNPNVARINAELSPGTLPGTGILDVRVTERQPWRIGIEARNDRPPSVGGEILEAALSHQNLTGNSDLLDLHWGLLERDHHYARISGVDNLGVCYRLPITARDTTLQLGYSRNNFAVLEEPFDTLDINSRSDAYSVALRQPLYQTVGRELAIGMGFDRKSSRSFLLGEPFSFSPGAVDGVTTISVLRFVQEYVDRNPVRVLSLRSSFNVGVGVIGADQPGSTRTAESFSWVGQAQFIRRLGQTANQLVLSTSGQWAADSLRSPELFSLGGATTVRGYRENQLVRDTGLLASAEIRLPILTRAAGSPVVQVAPFFDFGAGWNVQSTAQEPVNLISAGIGVLVNPNEHVSAQLYWGHPFRNLNQGRRDLQDLGLHFRLSVSFF